MLRCKLVLKESDLPNKAINILTSKANVAMFSSSALNILSCAFLIFILLLIVISRGFGLRGSFCPCALVTARTALQSRLCACCLLFSARLASRLTASSGKVAPHGALRVDPRFCTRMCMH
jgi:hypothetical protein